MSHLIDLDVAFYTHLTWQFDSGHENATFKPGLSEQNSSFDLRDSLLGAPFSSHATQKLGNSNALYYKKNNPVELKHCETSSSYRVFYPMKLKP